MILSDNDMLCLFYFALSLMFSISAIFADISYASLLKMLERCINKLYETNIILTNFIFVFFYNRT